MKEIYQSLIHVKESLKIANYNRTIVCLDLRKQDSEVYATLLVENTLCERGRRKLYSTVVIVVLYYSRYMSLGKKLMRDKEDDQAYIFNIIQKRPNAGCRDQNSGTPKQNKEYHESRYALYFHEEFGAAVTWPSKR